MKFSALKPFLHFTRSQRIGLVSLFSLIVFFQLFYFWFDFEPTPTAKSAESKAWLALEIPRDSASETRNKPKVFRFNPNFITDFKGYMLGMSVQEIDRLLAYRKTDRYVNSAQEFQQVTGVSDSLLAKLAPLFKFPDWVKNKKQFKKHEFAFPEKKIRQMHIDINLATQEDLKKVYGIGDGLSERILKEKERFGGFVSMEQIKDVWGLSDEVIANVNKDFYVGEKPAVRKIDINKFSIKELMQFPYFRYPLAKSIVTYRSMNGDIKSVEDLIKVSGFPVDKVHIIALYLEF